MDKKWYGNYRTYSRWPGRKGQQQRRMKELVYCIYVTDIYLYIALYILMTILKSETCVCTYLTMSKKFWYLWVFNLQIY